MHLSFAACVYDWLFCALDDDLLVTEIMNDNGPMISFLYSCGLSARETAEDLMKLYDLRPIL